MTRMTESEQLDKARELAEPPDVVDIEEQEPMLYLWQVEEILKG